MAPTLWAQLTTAIANRDGPKIETLLDILFVAGEWNDPFTPTWSFEENFESALRHRIIENTEEVLLIGIETLSVRLTVFSEIRFYTPRVFQAFLKTVDESSSPAKIEYIKKVVRKFAGSKFPALFLPCLVSEKLGLPIEEFFDKKDFDRKKVEENLNAFNIKQLMSLLLKDEAPTQELVQKLQSFSTDFEDYVIALEKWTFYEAFIKFVPSIENYATVIERNLESIFTEEQKKSGKYFSARMKKGLPVRHLLPGILEDSDNWFTKINILDVLPEDFDEIVCALDEFNSKKIIENVSVFNNRPGFTGMLTLSQTKRIYLLLEERGNESYFNDRLMRLLENCTLSQDVFDWLYSLAIFSDEHRSRLIQNVLWEKSGITKLQLKHYPIAQDFIKKQGVTLTAQIRCFAPKKWVEKDLMCIYNNTKNKAPFVILAITSGDNTIYEEVFRSYKGCHEANYEDLESILLDPLVRSDLKYLRYLGGFVEYISKIFPDEGIMMSPSFFGIPEAQSFYLA